ncbi:VOC family protein [Paenibacillus sp. 22594]|uniref:VOC family protein n=1 Tax=Paenibacillus sp. 22594 TaxID=3453947 RepID=UPI003F83724B
MIKKLKLYCSNLNQMIEFYTGVLNLPISSNDAQSFTLSVGSSELEYEYQSNHNSPYHIAFNIPENQIEDAMNWLKNRVELLDDNGDLIIFFEDWNAHSIYFKDPDGNIVELIARHNLNNSSTLEFSGKCLLNVSEIGLPVPDVLSAAAFFGEKYNLSPWRGQSETFTAVGDENGLIILVKQGRVWFMSDVKAEPQYISVLLKEHGEFEIHKAVNDPE